MKLVHTDQLPHLGVSHNTNIKKKVLIEKGNIPQLMNFSTATFKPGQEVEEHKHDTMYEVFYIQSGKAQFVVNGEVLTLQTGDCITIEPKEVHAQRNPFKKDVTWLYFGVATN